MNEAVAEKRFWDRVRVLTDFKEQLGNGSNQPHLPRRTLIGCI